MFCTYRTFPRRPCTEEACTHVPLGPGAPGQIGPSIDLGGYCEGLCSRTNFRSVRHTVNTEVRSESSFYGRILASTMHTRNRVPVSPTVLHTLLTGGGRSAAVWPRSAGPTSVQSFLHASLGSGAVIHSFAAGILMPKLEGRVQSSINPWLYLHDRARNWDNGCLGKWEECLGSATRSSYKSKEQYGTQSDLIKTQSDKKLYAR